MKYVFWFLTSPLRLFDAIASRLVEPPVDRDATKVELLADRNVLLEEIERPQAGGMGGGG